MAVIPVSLAGRSYDVTIEAGFLGDLASHAAPYLASFSSRAVPFVADTNTHRLYDERIEAALDAAGHTADWFVVEPGEAAKSWTVLERLTDWLLALGMTRSDHVFRLAEVSSVISPGLPAR